MCFSAGASFGAGILLSAVGLVSLKKADHSSEKMFAAIPLIFGVQQISEGFLWLSLTGQANAAMQISSTHVFLFFAQIVWPLWVPLSILLVEKNEKRKKILKVLTFTGALVSLYLAYCLVSFHVQASVVGQHISYHLDYPSSIKPLRGLLYLLVTVLPPFFSNIKRMWTLGAAIFISYLLTVIFYSEYVISVWCFFASVISVVVLVLVYQLRNSSKETLPAAH